MIDYINTFVHDNSTMFIEWLCINLCKSMYFEQL